ncbi:MAG: ABC transporter substrate-binding protein [Thermoanaerobaculales bacterium]|jgi:putative ABC transport system substrate-binding protein|nr:ABC transporter substrate-binding protein [Thermoanaerobaculales bacterium]
MAWVLAAALAATPAAASDTKTILGVFYAGCEDICAGFKAALDESGFPLEVIIRDVEQDRNRLRAMIEEARSLPADLVLTYGTTVTLEMVGTLDDAGDTAFLNDIPVVFTTVADPFGTRIAESFDGSGRANVTGTFNRVPEAVNIEVIRLYDESFDRLGLLYNSNEPNSVLKMRELAELADERGFELVALEIDPTRPGAPDPAALPERMAELREAGIRWIYLGSSSFLLANGSTFTAAAVNNGIAVVSPYESLVREEQALLSVAARREDIGRLAAEQALKILRDGIEPGALPIAQATDFAYVVNMDVARRLDRFPPFSFLQVAEVVGN